MYDLTEFDVSARIRCSAALRRCGEESTQEAAARCIVRHLYDGLVEGAGGARACPLVRLYRTFDFRDLDGERRRFATTVLGEEPGPDVKCLTLVATAGDEPAWNDPAGSVAHRAIPLVSERMVLDSPMISQLILQLGLEVRTLVRPDPAVIADLAEREYNVFYVPVAPRNPYIPAQESFVVPYRIKSALGFGGLLPSGDLFAVILFSRVFIPVEAATTFKTLALTVKSALLAPLVGRSGTLGL